MKMIVFLGLMVMICCNPCFAHSELNSIEAEGLLSLNNTLWQFDERDEIIGFNSGSVFTCISSAICAPVDGAFYFNFIFISYFRMDIPDYSMYGLLSPLLNNGQVIVNDTVSNEKQKLSIRKIQDPWTPDSFLHQ